MTGPMAAALSRFGPERRAIRLADIALAIWITVLAVVTVYGAATTTGFLTWSNLKAILTAAAFVGIIAVGLTVIVLSGSLFSLALGQTAAVSAMVFLYTLRIEQHGICIDIHQGHAEPPVQCCRHTRDE